MSGSWTSSISIWHDTQIYNSHLTPAETENLVLGPSDLCFNQTSCDSESKLDPLGEKSLNEKQQVWVFTLVLASALVKTWSHSFIHSLGIISGGYQFCKMKNSGDGW
jgi:hypothetical protein